jgi:hypothetical protein
MKYLLCLILFIVLSAASAQELEPVIPTINHQVAISEPVSSARSTTRNTNFGAVLAIENDLLVVGAPSEQIFENFTTYQGAVYIYRQSGIDSWVLEQKIVNPLSLEAGQTAFGISVSIDGGRIAIASMWYGVYFYEHQSGQWQHTATVEDADGIGSRDWFAHQIALRGNVLVVGEIDELKGKVHIYREIAGVWTFEALLQGDPNHAIDYTYIFGASIDISDDGSVIAIGEPDHPSNTESPGAVYAFAHDGAQWQLEKLIDGANAFGRSVDLLGSGMDILLAVGNTGTYTLETSISGTAHLFQRSADWSQIAVYTDPTETRLDQFGYTVKLVGTPQNAALIVSMIPQREEDYSIDPARFYVFDVATNTQTMEMISPGDTDFDDDGKIDTDQFGRALVVDGLGESLKIIVGAVGLLIGDGKTYVYSYNPTPQEMVNAGNFENSSRGLILNAWNRTPGAKLRCGRGVDASCGVKFKSGVSSKITQSVDLSQFPLNPGDGLLFQMDAKVKGAAVIKAKLKVFYADGFSAVVPLRVENTGGVYRTVMTAPAIFIANRPLAKIVVSIKHTATGGAAFIDNVSLVRVAGGSAR